MLFITKKNNFCETDILLRCRQENIIQKKLR